MDNETRIERLNATLYLASCVPPELLDQGNWTKTNCRTTHCIAGWCGVSPWHNERGFELSLGIPWSGLGTHAFAQFHGITYAEAHSVTIDNAPLSGMAAKKDVIRRLKALIHKYGGRVQYS